MTNINERLRTARAALMIATMVSPIAAGVPLGPWGREVSEDDGNEIARRLEAQAKREKRRARNRRNWFDQASGEKARGG